MEEEDLDDVSHTHIIVLVLPLTSKEKTMSFGIDSRNARGSDTSSFMYASEYFDGTTTPSCWVTQRHREAVLPVGILRVIRDVQPVQMLLLTPQEGFAEEQA